VFEATTVAYVFESGFAMFLREMKVLVLKSKGEKDIEEGVLGSKLEGEEGMG
jgi:hypothetical protein